MPHNISLEQTALLDYNSLTTTGNAEVQVATTFDGHTYAYLAGWNDMHIVDVSDPSNSTVTGVYNDPNTQVLDVKYLEYNGREYILQQNQLIDPGNWIQMSVNGMTLLKYLSPLLTSPTKPIQLG